MPSRPRARSPDLVDGLRIVDRPVGMEGAADHVDVELGEVGERLLEEGAPRLPDRRIGGRQVLLRGRAEPGGDRDPVVAGRPTDLGDMRRAVAVQVMGGDLDDVEAEPGDLFDVFQAIGAPLLLPVRVINAELHGLLLFRESVMVAGSAELTTFVRQRSPAKHPIRRGSSFAAIICRKPLALRDPAPDEARVRRKRASAQGRRALLPNASGGERGSRSRSGGAT